MIFKGEVNNLNELEKDYELIDKVKWEELLGKIKDKKIVIFGSGNNGQVLLEILPYKVDYFIDNDENKTGKRINDIVVNLPSCLEEETEDVCVLVTGFFYRDMINQLNHLKLKENIRIYNVYISLKHIFDKRSFFYRGEALINFIKSIPNNINYYTKNKKSKEVISVLITNCSFSSSTFYSIVLAVMLTLRGNRVELIWDDLEGFDELYYDYDDITDIQNKVIEKVLNYITQNFDIKVTKVSEAGAELIDDIDKRELKKLAKANTIAKFRKVFFDKEEIEYENKCFEVLENNFKKINGLFLNKKIEKIITFTGLHRKAGLYTWATKKYGVKSISYDGSSSALLMTTDGICTHYDHIRTLLKENKLTEEFSKKLIEFAEQNFSKRLQSANDLNAYVYQTVSYDENTLDYEYDVIIPLNIGWDAAALGYEGAFNSMGEWLIETVGFVLENTNAKIAVRQHPAERFFDSGQDIELKLKTLFSNNERFTYISSDEEINTYSLIKNAKIVLPYTSTIGIEAALLNKTVIIATDVYYSDMNFVKKAESKYEYFSLIKEALSDGYELANQFEDEAKLLYALGMLTSIKTEFTDVNFNSWINNKFDDLYNENTVKSILSIIESGNAIDIYTTQNRFNINILD